MCALCVHLLPVEQVRFMGNQVGPESRVVFLQHMRNTNTDSNVNTVNLRGFMDEVSACLICVHVYKRPLLIEYSV